VKGEGNGLRPVVIEKEMELRDGSRVCRCCSSSCSLHWTRAWNKSYKWKFPFVPFVPFSGG